jgi:hypothetical protein
VVIYYRGLLRVVSLAVGFVEEDGSGGTDVEGIDIWRHWDGDGFVAGGENLGADAITFAAEYDAAIAGEICLRQNLFIRMRVGSDTADAASLEFFETFHQGEFGGE